MAAQDYLPYETRLIQNYEGTKFTDGVKPYDPGGPTKFGITLADARLHWKANATADDVRNMPITVAFGIYKSKYWDAMWGDQLPAGLDGVVTDYGVNSGIGRSGKVLRRVLGLPDNTSKVTAEVLAAVAKRDVNALIDAISDERLKFLATLAIYPTYKGGWVKRVNSERSIGHELTKGVPAASPGLVTAAVPPSDVELTAKAMHPEPVAAKTAAKALPAPAAPVVYSNWDWVCTHLVQTGIMVGCVVVLALVVHKLITDSHTAKQEAPTPGVAVVPELTVAKAA